MTRPYAKGPRCGKWMPLARDWCVKRTGHSGSHMSRESYTLGYVRTKQRRAAERTAA